MRTLLQIIPLHICIVISITLCLFTVTEAADKDAYSGWEKESSYNGYYNFKERDSIKGKLLQFLEVTPLPEMAPGTAFILEEGSEKILVHLCPVAYRASDETGLRQGVKTKVSGCWTVIDGQDVFMAAKVKQGDSFEFKVRLTKDGTPFWSMSAAEQAQEAATK